MNFATNVYPSEFYQNLYQPQKILPGYQVLSAMNQFYVGDNNEFIQAAYAPTGRATCKACKEKIAVESIRLSYNIDSGHFSSTHWYHLNCFELKPKFQDIDPEQEIYNIDQLDGNSTDYQLAVDYINAEKERIKRGEKRPKPTPKAKESEPGKTTKEIKGKEQKKSQSEGEEDDKDCQDSDLKASKKSRKNAKKAEKSAKKKEDDKKELVQAYNPQQKKLYEESVEKYNLLSADALKQLLATNKQSKTGSKAELVEKCADGKVLGQIPQCPKCGGGRPKFNKDNATYKCPGYMDDDKYRHCHKTFQMEEIKREKWID